MRGIVLLFLCFSISAKASVWNSTQEWTQIHEDQYSDWVLKNWHKDFFIQPGPLQNLKFDCADLVYTMRAIYARNQGLPFVIKDPSYRSQLITNEMSRFDNYDVDLRFRKFLVFLHQIVSTASLPGDSFPIAIDRKIMRSGIFLITSKENHHAWTVQVIPNTGIPFLIYASRPARTKLSVRYEFPTASFLFPSGNKVEKRAGFRMFRQPHEVLKPEWELVGYSIDQFQVPANDWAKNVQAKIQERHESPEEEVSRLFEQSCIAAHERVEFVNLALNYLQKMGNRKCMNASEYDDYSTPGRDKRLLGNFEELIKAFNNYENKLSNQLKNKVLAVIAGDSGVQSDGGHVCDVQIGNNNILTLGQIYQRVKDGSMSNNPHDPLEMRWGIVKGHSDRALRCPQY